MCSKYCTSVIRGSDQTRKALADALRLRCSHIRWNELRAIAVNEKGRFPIDTTDMDPAYYPERVKAIHEFRNATILNNNSILGEYAVAAFQGSAVASAAGIAALIAFIDAADIKDPTSIEKAFNAAEYFVGGISCALAAPVSAYLGQYLFVNSYKLDTKFIDPPFLFEPRFSRFLFHAASVFQMMTIALVAASVALFAAGGFTFKEVAVTYMRNPAATVANAP